MDEPAKAPNGHPTGRPQRGNRWWLRTICVPVLALIIATLIPATRTGVTEEPPSLPIRGADISFTLQEEAIDRYVTDDGEVRPIEDVLVSHGANYVRLRVWVNPPSHTSDLAAALTLARRSHTAGLKLLLDLHYSDTWADRTSQWTPQAWRHLPQPDLVQTVERYTAGVVKSFADQHTPVDIVQIGNEVVNGMLWPVGQIYAPRGENWTGFTELVKAGVRGAKQGNPPHPPAIMMHTDTGGDAKASRYFFDKLMDHGVEFDYLGLTYYPFWNGSLAALRENVNALAAHFGKGIILAETAYPWTLSSMTPCPSVVASVEALPDGESYPATPEGQAMFFTGLNQLLREVPNGHGVGYFIWEPGWLAGVNAIEQVCNSHTNLTLFDESGNGLPALDAFRPNGAPTRR